MLRRTRRFLHELGRLRPVECSEENRQGGLDQDSPCFIILLTEVPGFPDENRLTLPAMATTWTDTITILLGGPGLTEDLSLIFSWRTPPSLIIERRCNGAAECDAARPMHLHRSPRSSASPQARLVAFDASHLPRFRRWDWRRLPFCLPPCWHLYNRVSPASVHVLWGPNALHI